MYTEADLRLLTRASELLGRHASYAWVRRLLREEILARSDRGRAAPEWRGHVHTDPAVLAGKPVVKGTRLGAAFLLELFAAGWTTDEVLENYPALPPEALRAVFGFAAACVDREARGAPERGRRRLV
jgi:uncharacterized protein (DUF433 family)